MKKINSIEDYKESYQKSIDNPERFWSDIASTFFWQKKWDNVLKWNFDSPEISWFEGAQLNITENCLDRHLKQKGDKTAIIWEPNDPSDSPQYISYVELHERVGIAAQMLKNNGISKGIGFVYTCPWFLSLQLQSWLVQELVQFTQ